MTLNELREAKNALVEALKEKDWFKGAGIGREPSPTLRVNVSSQTDEITTLVKQVAGNAPVVISEVGDIVKF